MIFLALLFKKAHLIEQKLQEQQAQLIHSGRLTAMGEMDTGIAHEINQPLTIIRLAADGLNSYFGRIGARSMEARAARKIVSQVDRCVTIIDNMRSFVRNTPHGNDAVNLIEALERALSFFREQFRVHEIELDVKVPQQAVRARINQQKFEQIVVNLLSNAQYAVEKRATAEKGGKKRVEVVLRADASAQEVVFSVQDNGTGMDEQVRQRCLEPFYTTKEVGEGTGLGLSIVHTILREINGASITVESRVGQGSCFSIRLPAAEGGSRGEAEGVTG
jgi:C4-dicarboxylate-specific signal transduction histidine kinase